MAYEDKNPQTDKDLALAKKMGRQPLLREQNESDIEYSQRLRRSPKLAVVLTDDQIKLAHDMHAVHSAMARGYVLPPLPVTDEQKADDEAKAAELCVKPIEREPGETDEAFDVRLAASPSIDAAGAQAQGDTIYPSHVDRPAISPVEHGAPIDHSNA